jgi:C-terminal processing protease CtpA/Prc
VRRLILDLRGNPGGSGRLSVGLLEALAGARLPTSGGKLWKRSREYEAGLADFVPPLLRLGPWRRAILGADGVATLDAIPWGETRLIGGVARPEITPVLPREAVDVLIDQGTGSSATQLARAIQVFRLGRLIGAPTSDGTTALGEIAFFRLPNSRLIFASPSAEFLDVSGERTEGPVMPDLLLCDGEGLFAAERALDLAMGLETPDVRQIESPAFRPEAVEADYCRS